jgi:riboflavin kinase/FMN adenylyltransferase
VAAAGEVDVSWRNVYEAVRAPRVVALGNFDGVHRGHAAVIGEAVRQARAAGHRAAVLVLDPHPDQVLRPDRFEGLLTPLAERAALVRALGVEDLLVLPFDRTEAARSPASFVADVLVARLGARAVVVGENFHYGHGGAGDVTTLASDGARLGLAVTVVPPVVVDGELVSASRVRAAVRAGEMEAARRLLGRPYALTGEVVHGDGRGRTLGFPTANIAFDPIYVPPRHGVYAVSVPGYGGGVANFGPRPTVGSERPTLEVHLFQPPPDLYGRRLEVHFWTYLRPQVRFPDLDALKRQIAEDAARARAFIASALGL